MQVAQTRLLTKQARIWTGFLWYAIRRSWWLMAAFVVFGVIWGYFTAIATPNVYESRASFVMPGEQAIIEFERLLSRSLVIKYIAQDRRFEVSNFIHRPLRPPLEMYTNSPFQIRVVAFPDHLRNMVHRIKLLDDSHFEIAIHTQQQEVVAQGEVGVLLEMGSARLVVEATDFWNKEAPGLEYSFVVQSQEALANRVMRNLSLFHELDHPTRINLHYSDVHPQLALEIMAAFTQGYLQESKIRREEQLRERQAALVGEMKSLETKMLASQGGSFWSNLFEKGLIVQDSSVTQMLQLRRDMEAIQRRQQIWKEYQKGALLPEALCRQVGAVATTPQDSMILMSVARYQAAAVKERESISKEIGALVDSSANADAQKRASMETRIVDVNAGMMGSRVLAFEFQRSIRAEGASNEALWSMLGERYLAAMNEVAKIELETRKELQPAQLIDPPYLMPGHGRGHKLRVLLAWIAGMGLSGFFLGLLLSFSSRRIGSIFHFQSISGQDKVHQWKLGGSESEQRLQSARLEITLKPEDKVIALIGASPDVDHLADSIARGFISYGRRVLMLNSILDGEKAGWDRLVLPASTRPGWWFSPAAGALLQEKALAYDRILLCLPNLDVAPEAVAAIRQAHVVFFLLQDKRTKVNDWRRWEEQAQEFGIEAKPFYVTQA